MLGELTDELETEEKIVDAVFAGAKNYAYRVKSSDGKQKDKIKIRGFTLDSYTEPLLTMERMKKSLRAIQQGEDCPLPVKRFKIVRPRTGVIVTREETKIYRVVHHKNVLGEDGIYRPFGYRE